MLHSSHMMNGSPQMRDEEQPSTSVSPRNYRYATASRSPSATSLPAGGATSDRDVSPFYLYSSSLTRPSSPSPPTSSVRRRSWRHSPEMAIRLAYHLEPERSHQHGKANFNQTLAESELPTVISPLPEPVPELSHPPPVAPSIIDEDRQAVTPLHELSRLLRQQKYHKSRSRHAEERLRHLQIAAARTNRLTCASRSIQHTLAECIKSEDRNSFVNLLHAVHDATEDVNQVPPSSTGSEMLKPPPGSFLEDLTTSSRTTVLDFMSKIRHDSSFVADQLEKLSHRELVALLPDGSSSRPNESIFASSLRNSSRTSRPLGFVVDAQVDLLSSYSYCSPLETLIFGTQSLSNFGLSSDARATDVWSTVCARLISQQKPGSEKLVPAVLDTWASSISWPGKDRLEIWILETLKRGAFLLDMPSRHTFKARIEGGTEPPAEEELRMDTFFSQAVNDLLDLLADTSGGSVIPSGALTMARASFDKLADHSSHQRGLPQFLITRWLASSFLIDAVTLPEAHGLLTDHYISEIARQRILREVVARVQKAVYEVAYSWKHGSNATMDMTRRVSAVMARFQPVPPQDLRSDARLNTRHAEETGSETFIALSAKDIVTSINALYPQQRPASVLSDFDSSRSGLRSSASSISGFSLFGAAKTPDVYSPISGLWSPESQPAIANSVDGSLIHGEGVPVQENSHIQEARLELEDLLASGDSSSWDILVIAPGSKHLQTLRDRSSQVDARPESRDLRSCTDLTHERVMAKKAIKQLLNSFDSIPSTRIGNADELLSTVQKQLESLLERRIQEFEAQSDFVGAHTSFQQLQDFQTLTSQSLDPLRDILSRIDATARESAASSLTAEKRCEEWTRLLQPLAHLRTSCLTPLVTTLALLRDKMWYTSHVRPSAAYDSARSIASALRIMGKSKKSSSSVARTRLAPPLRHWSATKSTTNTFHLKSEAQVLELLSAKVEHCGPNKLSDEQSRSTEAWLEKMGIDNLCRGEERLHRLCMEVRKCVESVFVATPEHSIIHANPLFAKDEELTREMGNPPPNASLASSKNGLLSSLYAGNRQSGMLTLQTQLRGIERVSNGSQTLSNASSRDYMDARSPTLTSKSSNPFWSPAMTEVDSPGSATSVGSARTEAALEPSSQQQHAGLAQKTSPSALEKLRQRLTSLVLSDLTANLFTEGSETDIAFWTGLGWTLVERHFKAIHAAEHPQGAQISARDPTPRFDFLAAFTRLFQKFSASSNPATKLSCLHDIDRLLRPYMASLNPSLTNTKNTSDISVTAFRHLFTHPTLLPSGPRTIFRDLQYIASLLPSATLHPSTPAGRSFTNACLAIAGLKSSSRTLFVETADAIIAYHSNNRPGASTAPHPPSPAQAHRDSIFSSPSPSSTSLPDGIATFTLSSASHLLSIAAREGDAVAQRELATLYLTHPTTTPLILAPFARTGDVFREELESKWRSGGGRGKGSDREKCDPRVMCVAYFWMGRSARGGDGVAKRVLEQGSEMGGLGG